VWHEAGFLTLPPTSNIRKIITVWESRKAKMRSNISNVSLQISQKQQQNEATEAENPKREAQTSSLQSTLEAASKKCPHDHRSQSRKRHVTQSEMVFDEQLNPLFDVAAPDQSQPEDRLHFLIDQRTTRAMKLGGRVGLTGMEKRKQKTLEKQKIQAEKEADDKVNKFETGLLCSTTPLPISDNLEYRIYSYDRRTLVKAGINNLR
jgi:hypothetical protein